MSKSQAFKDLCLKQFSEFEQGLNGERADTVHLLRKEAVKHLETLTFPTVKDEEWKYTDFSSMLDVAFTNAADSKEAGIIALEQYAFQDFDAYSLVFLDGVFRPELSNLPSGEPGIVVQTLEEAYKTNPELVLEKCNIAGKHDSLFFSALNTAFLKAGVFIQAKKNCRPGKPISILYVQSSSLQAVHLRNIIIAEPGAEISFLENYVGSDGTLYFNNIVTGIFVGENAKVQHIKIQDESVAAYHVAYTEVFEEQYATYTNYNLNFGSKAARNTIETHFTAENSEAHLYGLYIGGSGQLIDNHTLIDHAKPNCQSNELYKGVLAGNARGVFNGKVLVRKDAQKTNAFQSNKNILLSDEAIIDTKPQLEIFADDVKCSHGATIGQLDEAALFYLRSRGFSKDLAKSMLIFAFADDTIKSISYPGVVAYLERLINTKLHLDF